MRLVLQACLAAALAAAAVTPDASGGKLAPSVADLQPGPSSPPCKLLTYKYPRTDSFHRNLAAAETQLFPPSHDHRFDPVDIPLWFHVITSSNITSETADYMAVQLEKQTRIIQQIFAPANISFSSVNTTWTVHPDWAFAGSDLASNYQMKSALHQGGFETLNLYIHENADNHSWCENSAAIFGQEYLDGMARKLPEDLKQILRDLHGDVAANKLIQYAEEDQQIPNVTFATADRTPFDGCHIDSAHLHPSVEHGAVLVQVIGLWLGLLHTFYGGCDVENDFIADTPAMLERAACGIGPDNLDSCPNLQGLDPVENVMGFSFTSSSPQFTPGQIRRMHTLWKTYRSGKP